MTPDDERWRSLWQQSGLAHRAVSTPIFETLRAEDPAISSTLDVAAIAATAAPDRGPSPSPSTDPLARTLPPQVSALPTTATSTAALPLLELAGTTPTGTAVDLSSDFLLVTKLGEGGMGQVDLARQQTLARDVAIKRLKPGVTQGTAFASLLAEARTMGELEHPNIVPVHLLARDAEGRPVLVMKRIEGVPWQRLIDDPQHPFWDKLTTRSRERLVAHLEILMQLCTALHFAHSRGVVHRDIKPENVMLGAFGELYLLDWGIAVRMADLAANDRHTILGTPAFMAPEMVATPSEVSPATDVFLLGATLYLLLTGRYRFEGETVEQTLFRAFRCEPATYPENASADLVALCERAMALRPADRFSSADALRLALVDYLRHRESRKLGRAAEVTRLEIEKLLARPKFDDDQRFGRRVQSLLVECRFGFQQALAEWPENPTAQGGFRGYLQLAFDYEVRLKNLEGARALFAEAGGADPEMKAKLDALVEERRVLSARQRKLSAFERDQDPRAGIGARRIMVGVMLVVVSVIAVFGLAFRPNQAALTHRDLLIFNGVTLGIWIAGGVVFRKAIAQSALNRRGAGLIAISFVLACGVRLLGWRYGIKPEHILHLEMWIYAALIVAGAVLFLPSLWASSLPFVIGALLAVFVPEATSMLFALAGVAGFVMAIYAWQLDAKAPEPTAPK